jgi:hypothetical protein
VHVRTGYDCETLGLRERGKIRVLQSLEESEAAAQDLTNKAWATIAAPTLSQMTYEQAGRSGSAFCATAAALQRAVEPRAGLLQGAESKSPAGTGAGMHAHSLTTCSRVERHKN